MTGLLDKVKDQFHHHGHGHGGADEERGRGVHSTGRGQLSLP